MQELFPFFVFFYILMNIRTSYMRSMLLNNFKYAIKFPKT